MPWLIKSGVGTYLSDQCKCKEHYTDNPYEAQRFSHYLDARELAFDSEQVVNVQFEGENDNAT